MSKNNEQQPWSTRRIAFTGFAFLTGGILFFHGFPNIDIYRNEARTTATVTGSGAHGVIYYRYEVSGQTYSGAGNPGFQYAPFPVGSTFEIRYSTVHPARSTARHPLDFLGELAVAWLFLAGMLYLHYTRTTRRNGRNT